MIQSLSRSIYNFFYCQATRDILAIVLLIIETLAGVAFLFQLTDSKSHRFQNLYSDSKDAYLVYAMSSLILFSIVLMIIGICCAIAKRGLRAEFDQSLDTYKSLEALYYGVIWFYGSFAVCGGGGGNGMAICVLVVFVIPLATVLLLGLLFGIVVLFALIQLRTIRLWRRQELEKYVVKHLGGEFFQS